VKRIQAEREEIFLTYMRPFLEPRKATLPTQYGCLVFKIEGTERCSSVQTARKESYPPLVPAVVTPRKHLTERLPFPLFARSMIGIGGIVLQVGRMSRGVVGHEVWRKLRVAKSSSTTKRLLGLLLEEGDKVCEGMVSWVSCFCWIW
jgi:hypothetical protein